MHEGLSGSKIHPLHPQRASEGLVSEALVLPSGFFPGVLRVPGQEGLHASIREGTM